MEEQWKLIREFPMYVVSDQGNVAHRDASKPPLTHSLTQHGEHTVGLMKDGHQYRRSVKVLVARAFVDTATDIFNTPILLNGDRGDLRAVNIRWRPRWFALMYQKQFDEIEDWWYVGPVLDQTDDVVYEDLLHAAISTGTLVRSIRLGMMNKTPVFPTGHMFVFC